MPLPSLDLKKYIPEFILNFLFNLKKFLRLSLISFLALTVIFFWVIAYSMFSEDDSFGSEQFIDAEQTAANAESATCNVMKIRLQGDLLSYIPYDSRNESGGTAIDATSSEDIVITIEDADRDESIKAIIMEIDSMGGYPTAAEEVANALKRSKKIAVALIRGNGNSAAYWSATGADLIYASATSDVGSIGVTNSYLDNSKKNEKEGLTYNQISTGKFKDMFSPDKPLTNEERTLVERDLKITHENFVRAVSENRKLDIEKVRLMSDGSSMLGQMALKNGLIDKIGGMNEVKEYLVIKIGEGVEVCE